MNFTTKKRLIIDLRLLRQSNERHEIVEVLWIPSSSNPADALTKKKPFKALEHVLIPKKLELHPKGLVERPTKTNDISDSNFGRAECCHTTLFDMC